jgi:multiple sugar transport system ATP-binding protein
MGSVVLDNVTKVYRGGTVAVRSLSLAIEPGQFFVLLGPSGCGKTTMLRIVAGLEYPTEGLVFIDGEDVTEKSPKDRDVAMVFQQYSLYPHMTVQENIAFGLQSRRLKKTEVEGRVKRVASVLEVDGLLRKKPRALSGGQQQRVAMGRALVREPAAFLLDEPLSNLDARLRLQMRAEIARIQKDIGITTIYVTHDQTEAMTLGDQVGVLRDGSLQQVASPAQLYRGPRNLFVAGFVGSPPMNLAEATVEEADGELYLRFSGQRIRMERSLAGALREYAWRQVVVGVRPEDLDDAAAQGTPPDARLHLVVERRETIGADVYLYFRVNAPLLLAEDPRESSGPDGRDGSWAAERANVWMARTGSTGGQEGETVELGARPGRLYLFDPRTGASIGR